MIRRGSKPLPVRVWSFLLRQAMLKQAAAKKQWSHLGKAIFTGDKRMSAPSNRWMCATLVLAALVGASGVISVAGDDGSLRDEAKLLFGTLAAVPAEAQQTPDVQLGRRLFWDMRASVDGKTSCASCHLAADWGADRRRFSPDARGKLTARHSQTVLNSILQTSLRWTGDRKSGAHQAERSLTGSMGFESAEAGVAALKRLGYEPAFRTAYPEDADPVSPANYGRALQAYQATLVTPAPFDRFLNGDDAALSEQQKSGLKTFLSSGCADCHHGALLGGDSIETFGMAKDYWTATGSDKIDVGRFEVTGDESDRYKFRVPMLRNIAKTAPYFHDGSVAKLDDAVRIMAEVQFGNRLSEQDVADIVAFLESLTGAVPEHFAPPSTGSAAESPPQ
jgi:cytochrome c peroxidase